MVEYTLVGSLVLLAAIVGLSSLEKKLNEVVISVKQDMTDKNQKARSYKAARQAAIAQMKQKVLEQQQNQAGLNSLEGSQATIATVGANGTTKELANNITLKAKQSLSNGEISQEEYDIIVRVANKGHEIAALQGMLSSAASSANGAAGNYDSMSIMFNGKSYNPSELSQQLKTSVDDFQSLQVQAAQKERVMRSIALLSTLQESGGQILNLGWDSINNTQSSAKAVYVSARAEEDGHSTETHVESGKICNSGGHNDTGTNCNR